MALVPQFTQAQIKSKVDAFIQVIEKRQIQRLQYLGEQCVTKAKLDGNYLDQTDNLRSSIGYVIFKNGVALSQLFSVVGKGAKGVNEGRTVAFKIGSKFREGVCLVVVAGMDYAFHVETKGYDVLTSTELFAIQEMPKLLAALKNNINSALG